MPPETRELHRLLNAPPSDKDDAWRAFVSAYSRLLLHVARTMCRDRDEAMDAYAFILDELRAKDSARLRAFADDGRSKLSTWLVVVARRLCLDHRRQRYGRNREAATEVSRQDRLFRQRLGSLAGEAIDLDGLAGSLVGVDEQMSREEIRGALAAVLESLPTADRLLLTLRFENDMSAQQIATMLHFPSPFHVYRRLETLRRTIRRALEARGVESAAP